MGGFSKVHMGLMVWVWFGWDWTGHCSVSILGCLGSDAAGVLCSTHWQLFDLEL